MKMLQKGDKCPMCGRPIKTDDPNKLIVISAFGWIREQEEAGKWHPENSVCEDGSTGATNADKLRSLPDEELNLLIMCPGGIGGFEGQCKMNSDRPEENYFRCSGDWMKSPYKGWNNEKRADTGQGVSSQYRKIVRKEIFR